MNESCVKLQKLILQRGFVKAEMRKFSCANEYFIPSTTLLICIYGDVFKKVFIDDITTYDRIIYELLLWSSSLPLCRCLHKSESLL